jgi:hypothetical protein
MHIKSFRQKDRHGNEMAVEFFDVPPMMTPEYDHPGDPKGPDTVPAWLTPGEFVVNAEATRMFEPQIEAMNNIGREVQAAQGGTIPEGGTMPNQPVYAQSGRYIMPDFLSDDALAPIIEGMYATETSSGANVKTSEDGAVGPMQILPSTAANPGYGVRPRTEDEIMNLEGAQDFAREYLRGIHRFNPDFDLNQTITAYHSGAGNVKKAADGTEALGPRGEAYAGKVLDAAGEQKVSMLDQVGGFLSELNPFGISTAEAAPAVPAMADVPKEDDKPFSIFGFEPFVASDAVKKRNADTNMAMTEANAERAAERFNEMESKRLANLAAGRDEFEGINKDTYRQRKDALKFQQDKMVSTAEEYADAAGLSVPEMETMLQQQRVAADQIGALTPEEVAVAQTNAYQEHVGRASAAGQVPMSPSDFIEYHKKDKDGQSPANRAAPFSDNAVNEIEDEVEVAVNNAADDDESEADDSASSTANSVINNTDSITVEGEKSINDFLASLPDNPEEQSKLDAMAGKVGEWFSTAFSDLFSGPELARMAIMYAGSRVMGYNHSNSLNYSMKGYMKNVDAQIKARQEFITDDDNLETFTKESLAKYRKTGKVTDLVEKPTSAGVKKRGDKIYHRQLGVLPTVIGTDDIERVVINGKKYRLDDSAIAPFLEDYQESLHDEGNIKRSFRTDGKIYLDSVNQNREADKQVPEGEIIKISDEAITLYNTKKLRYGGMQAASRADLMRNINLAQDDYYKAYALHLEDPDENRKPQSLEEFYNARMISIDTGGVLSYNDIQGTEARRFAKIDKTWGDRAYKEANEDPKKASIAYKRIIKQYKDAWDKYTIMANSGDAKKNFLNAGGEKINPFLNWVSQCQQGNKDALKVFEIVKKQK